MVVAARAPELGDGAAEVRPRDVAALLGPSLDGGGHGGPARRAQPQEPPREEVALSWVGGRSGGGGEGFRVRAEGATEEGEEQEARAARESGHGHGGGPRCGRVLDFILCIDHL